MPDTTSVGEIAELPRSLRPASLWKRALMGLITLVVGATSAAWLLHASIDPPSLDQRAGKNKTAEIGAHSTTSSSQKTFSDLRGTNK